MRYIQRSQTAAVIEHITHACYFRSIKMRNIQRGQTAAAIEHKTHVCHLASINSIKINSFYNGIAIEQHRKRTISLNTILKRKIGNYTRIQSCFRIICSSYYSCIVKSFNCCFGRNLKCCFIPIIFFQKDCIVCII